MSLCWVSWYPSDTGHSAKQCLTILLLHCIYYYTKSLYAECRGAPEMVGISTTMLCHYVECRIVFNVMLNVIMLGAVVSLRHLTFSITMLYHYAECRIAFIVMLNVIMLSVGT
jgi:hypothetical protein